MLFIYDVVGLTIVIAKIFFKRIRPLNHFVEAFHAPFLAEYYYWPGLLKLLLIHIVVTSISCIDVKLDPKIPVQLLSTIPIISGLLLVKR